MGPAHCANWAWSVGGPAEKGAVGFLRWKPAFPYVPQAIPVSGHSWHLLPATQEGEPVGGPGEK